MGRPCQWCSKEGPCVLHRDALAESRAEVAPPVDEVEAQRGGLADRLARYCAEWLWNDEPNDDERPGYGPHMLQMLYRMPKDSQTRDMQASIESMISDLGDVLSGYLSPTAVREREAAAWDAGYARCSLDRAEEVLGDPCGPSRNPFKGGA